MRGTSSIHQLCRIQSFVDMDSLSSVEQAMGCHGCSALPFRLSLFRAHDYNRSLVWNADQSGRLTRTIAESAFRLPWPSEWHLILDSRCIRPGITNTSFKLSPSPLDWHPLPGSPSIYPTCIIDECDSSFLNHHLGQNEATQPFPVLSTVESPECSRRPGRNTRPQPHPLASGS